MDEIQMNKKQGIIIIKTQHRRKNMCNKNVNTLICIQNTKFMAKTNFYLQGFLFVLVMTLKYGNA